MTRAIVVCRLSRSADPRDDSRWSVQWGETIWIDVAKWGMDRETPSYGAALCLAIQQATP